MGIQENTNKLNNKDLENVNGGGTTICAESKHQWKEIDKEFSLDNGCLLSVQKCSICGTTRKIQK